MRKYFPGFVIHVPNGNHRKEHQSTKNGKSLKPSAKIVIDLQDQRNLKVL